MSDKEKLGGKLAYSEQEQEDAAAGGNVGACTLYDGVPSVAIYIDNPADLSKHAYKRDDELPPAGQARVETLCDTLLLASL